MTTDITSDFTSWAGQYSQRTNRSLAGARLVDPQCDAVARHNGE